MLTDAKAIGQRIRQFRKETGMSQTELAELLGKALRTVQKYEKGEIEVTLSVIGEIADALGVSPAEMLNAEETDTGLSDKAVEMLARLKKENSPRLGVINMLLEQADEDISDDYELAGWYNGSVLNAVCRYLDGSTERYLSEEFEDYAADPRRYDNIRAAVHHLILNQAVEAIEALIH